MSTLDHLVYMANQIARNFGTLDRDTAAEATADHMQKYWDPRMKIRIITHARKDGSDLSEVAALAVGAIAQTANQSAANA